MKKLDRLILKSFIGPLVLTFTIAVFVLLMQFVWKYIDDLVGKGLEFSVIAELLFYASATFVPMALPIAVLFASIMTMGNFGEKYELVAMKAGGVSIRRVMMPMAFLAILLTAIAFYFANNVMPTAMLKYRVTLYDVTRKKPALNIRPSEYYTDIDGYVIRVNQKDKNGLLHDVIIYDKSNGRGNSTVIVAESGLMQTSPDNQYLVFTLNNGYSYSEETEGSKFVSRPFTTIHFDQQVITFDISSFAYNKSDGEFFSGNYQMLNVSQLAVTVDSLEQVRDHRYVECTNNVIDKMRAYVNAKDIIHGSTTTEYDIKNVLSNLSETKRHRVIEQAKNVCRLASDDVNTYYQITRSDSEYINRHYIEWQRKYTLSLACLLMFLIGAPFGSIVRKGGLGMPLVASVVFFVLYYVIGMIAEKAVREGAIPPIGMWISSFVFLPIGILLTLQATTDSAFFDPAIWRSRLHRWLKINRKK